MREEAWEPEFCDYLRQIVKGFLFVILLSPAKEEGTRMCKTREHSMIFQTRGEEDSHVPDDLTCFSWLARSLEQACRMCCGRGW